jgi:hypothetical protein
VRKYDAGGNAVLTRQFGTNVDDLINGVSSDSSGTYVAGVTQGALPGQTKAGSFTDTDAFVRKYDTAGTILWTYQFGSANPDSAFGVDVDASGVYVAGNTSGTLPGSTGSGSAFVRKYEANANLAWTRQFGPTSGLAAPRGIAVDASGIYVAGFVGGTFAGQTSGGGSCASTTLAVANSGPASLAAVSRQRIWLEQ